MHLQANSNNKDSNLIRKFLPHSVLILISAIIYLPFIRQFGYYFDDWYFMYAGGVRGASVFWEIWSIDRPGGALLMQPLYSIFGQNAIYYNLSAYGFRLLSSFGLLEIGRLLWPRAKVEISVMALFYLIYPGFLSQPNGIVYQFYVAGLAAATWSIALTIKAVTQKNIFKKISFFIFSILLGIFYLAQIEWYIGFEVIRWALIVLLVRREKHKWWSTLLGAIQRGWPALLSPTLFLAWRIFFFENTRGATDVGLQLGRAFSHPLQTIYQWVTSLAQSMFSVLLTAWVSPLTEFGFSMDHVNKAIGLFIGVIAIALWYISSNYIDIDKNAVLIEEQGQNWTTEAFWIGLIGLAFGLAPVIIANRTVAFPSYSRYTLVSSLGAVMIIVVGISRIQKKYIREISISFLILISALTHYGNGLEYAKWANAYRNFWWQISWRIPQLERGSTLVANYAVGATEEDYFVWGPANLIYYPDGTRDEYVQPGVYAALLNQDTVIRTLLGEGQKFNNRRTIRTYQNYRTLLILTQPTKDSCVHVIDGEQPEYSRYDHTSIMILGPYSHPELIQTNQSATIPPLIGFGPEPEHNWCYFYQKASLARQRQDWNEVQRLGTEVTRMNLSPGDPIEWMPFLQAYALYGNVEQLKNLAPNVVADPYIAQQSCHILIGLSNLPQLTIDVIRENYCIN